MRAHAITDIILITFRWRNLQLLLDSIPMYFLERCFLSFHSTFHCMISYSLFHRKQIIHCYPIIWFVYTCVLCNTITLVIHNAYFTLHTKLKILNISLFLHQFSEFWNVWLYLKKLIKILFNNHSNRMSIFSTKNNVCFDEIQHGRYWYNGILKTSHEHSTMQFDNFFMQKFYLFCTLLCIHEYIKYIFVLRLFV